MVEVAVERGRGARTAGRNEWLLVTFTVATNLADAITRVALPLLAVRLTSEPGPVAAVAVLLTLPWLVTALHVGVLVDRMNRRTLMIAAEIARLCAIGLLLAAVVLGPVSLPMIYAVALVLGVAEVVAMTAGSSIVPSAVPRERWQAVSVRITAMEYLCNGFLGAPLGGFLVAAGMGLALGATGVIYGAGIVLLVLLVGAFAPQPSRQRRPVHAEIRDGLRFLWGHRLLRTNAMLITVMAACWSAWLALIPTYATGPLGLDERRYGLLLTAMGAGGVIGALTTGPVNRLVGRRWAMFTDIVGSFLLVATPAVVAPRPESAVGVAVAAFLAGIGGTMWTVNARVLAQSLVPNDLLGRYGSASRLIGWGMTPVAAVIAGALAQTAGFRIAFGVFALACAALVIPFLRVLTPAAFAEADALKPGS